MAIDTKRVTRRKFVGMLGALGTGVGVSACGLSVRRETERNAYAAEAASPAVASPIVSSHATHTTSATGSSGEPGVCAFHCHILSHAESVHGMFGMVTALIVEG
jgi:hypothetical protein